MAEKAHQEHNSRYFVLPNAEGKVRLIVTDRDNFRGLKQKGYVDASVKMDDVKRRAFYYTADAADKGSMSEQSRRSKQLEYYEWYSMRLDRDRKRGKL